MGPLLFYRYKAGTQYVDDSPQNINPAQLFHLVPSFLNFFRWCIDTEYGPPVFD